ELLEMLEDTYRVPRDGGDTSAIWRDIHLVHSRTLVARPERLVSNWLELVSAPKKLRFYEFRGHVSERQARLRMDDAPWPLVAYQRGFLSFARLHDLKEHFGRALPIKQVAE